MTPSGRIFDAEQRKPGQPAARPLKLACPECKATVTVYEDEIGQSGACPGCGARIAVPPEAFAHARLDSAESAPDSVVEATLVRPERTPVGKAGTMRTAVPPSPPLVAAREVPSPSAQDSRVQYAIWQGVAEAAGDWAMAARLNAIHTAEQAGCAMTLRLADGTRVPIPEMVLCEAAVAAFQGQTEEEWRHDWTRRLLKVAARWPDVATIDAIVAVLLHVDAVVAELRTAGVWPWPPNAPVAGPPM